MLDLRQMAKLCTTKKYLTDDVIFYQGDPGAEMFILLAGTVGVYLNNIDGSSVQITKIFKGNFFGEMSLLDEAPRSATIQALEDCMVLVITKKNFQSIVSQQPSFAFRLLKVLSSRIRHLNQRLIEHENVERPLHREEKMMKEPGSIFSKEAPEQIEKFHQGQDEYKGVVAPENHNTYLFSKAIICPCCNESITVKMMRTTIIPLERIDADLREVYTGFEPLWYQIWVCSHCGYASFHLTFLQVNQRVKDFIRESSSLIKNTFTLGFSEPRTLYEVFNSYYHLLYIMENSGVEPMDMAKIWLRLCWLYRDLGEGENEEHALKRSLHYYQEAYYNTSMIITPKQEARMNLLMGEILFKIEERKEALRKFHNALENREGEEFVKFHARNRVEDIRGMG